MEILFPNTIRIIQLDMADERLRPIGRGVPMGRGSLLDMLKKQTGRGDTPTPPPSFTPVAIPNPGTLAPSLGRGRAALLGLIKKSTEGPAQIIPSSEPAPISTISQQPVSAQALPISEQPPQARGRASLLSLMKKQTPFPVTSQTSMQFTPPGLSGDLPNQAISAMASLTITESVVESEVISRQGLAGTTIDLNANYIRLNVDQGRGVHEYEVKYSPDLDSRPLRSKLLYQHSVTLGEAKIFNGVTLHLAQPLPENRTELQSEHPMDGSIVKLTIIFKRQRRLGELPGLFNVLFKRVMHALDLVQIGQKHFNSRAAHSVPQHRLELWPGYVTAIDEYEGGLQLCLESTHRVLRTETVRDLINQVYTKHSSGHFRDAVMKELMGVSVLTRYNNKVYRIDDINWDENPLKEFTLSKDPQSKMSLYQYYKNHWNIEIRDQKQPLLIHRAKKRLPSGEQIEESLDLIPELCYLSGLTESMRQDFKVMKDLSEVTRISPEHRVDVAHRFIQEVKKNEIARKLLASWGLNLADHVVALPGRVVPTETIFFGNNKQVQGQANADWNSAACRLPMLSTPGLKNWCLIYCQRDSKSAEDFSQMFPKVGEAMGMQVSVGHLIKLKDDRTETFLRELRQNISPTMEIMVIVFPTNRNDRYAAVKKLCCVEMPIASQVIISRTINRPDKLKSVTQKIALQINCKLGGTLWALKSPMDNVMVCGIDIHHAGAGQSKHGSVAGFVASLDKPFTRWFSKVCLHRPNQELIDALKVCLISALKAYFKVNQRFPTRIIIYRDGVGDGQLEVIKNFEVKQLEESFALIAPDYKPTLTVIIVQKRINTKIFLKEGKRLANPPPGTVVDHTITRRNYYDFFLVSQNVRQGTVSPTHYLVIHDTSEMKTDHVQRLSFKLCHMYYNWPGTVRVPAPCQYAHKLAFLVGQSIQMEPHQSLWEKLYYL
ncbi:piwi-like protein Ago3 isoform X1 [Neodiprion lecontei]|uniref:Piwi-like protein Ago3 isoform X1 n=2 Tax=Neodiprion lecontei TaxID=441921 RepID=A0ABM3FCL7_NEOLC|nr:piwi-like protein Ago3 isoform X1 [Neodiprion lecontei]